MEPAVDAVADGAVSLVGAPELAPLIDLGIHKGASMLQSKASGNMSEYEEQMLINTVSELRMELIRKKPALDFVKKAGEDTLNSTSKRGK